jgi:hypothetical protein
VDNKPTLTLRNDDIEKFTGQSIDELNIDDKISFSIRCKVTSIDKHKPYECCPVAVGEQPKEPARKQELRLELEIIGQSDTEMSDEEYFRRERKKGRMQ